MGADPSVFRVKDTDATLGKRKQHAPVTSFDLSVARVSCTLSGSQILGYPPTLGTPP